MRRERRTPGPVARIRRASDASARAGAPARRPTRSGMPGLLDVYARAANTARRRRYRSDERTSLRVTAERRLAPSRRGSLMARRSLASSAPSPAAAAAGEGYVSPRPGRASRSGAHRGRGPARRDRPRLRRRARRRDPVDEEVPRRHAGRGARASSSTSRRSRCRRRHRERPRRPREHGDPAGLRRIGRFYVLYGTGTDQPTNPYRVRRSRPTA